MRLYITIVVVLLTPLLTSLSAQDIEVGTTTQNELEAIPQNGVGTMPEHVIYNRVVEDYIRVGRVTDKRLIRGVRIRSQEDLPFKKIGLTFSAGSTDFGFGLSTPINDKFKIRIGGGIMPSVLTVNKKIAIHDDPLRIRVGGYYPDYDVDFKPTFFNGHLLASYYPIRDIPLHITGGVYMGVHKIKARGFLINPETGERSVLVNGIDQGWPKLNVEGDEMDIEDGVLNANIYLGDVVKPYLGIGYGYVVPNSNWSFNVDLGAIYQDKYKQKQFGVTPPKFVDINNPSTHYESSAIDIKKYMDRVKIWPVLNVQVSYRIF